MGDWIRVCATSELLPGESKVAWDGDTRFGIPRRDDLRFEVLEKTFGEATA